MGKYRHSHIWFDSRFHEDLIQEGVVQNHNWALIKKWYPSLENSYDARMYGQRYILRIDISEWHHAYFKLYSKIYNEKMLKSVQLPFGISGRTNKLTGIGIDNSSPGWWDNGFTSQLCFFITVAKYENSLDRFSSIVQTGIDCETFDYNDFVHDILNITSNIFCLFQSEFQPSIPNNDF